MKNTYFLYLLLLSAVFATSCNNEREASFAYGNFEADDIIVSAEVSGKLKAFTAEEGSRVKEDEFLGYIDSTQLYLKKQQLIASANSIKSGLAELNAQIKVEEVKLSNLEREHRRFSNLVKDEAATQKQLDDIEGQLETARAGIDALRVKKEGIYSSLEANEMQQEQVEDQLENCLLEAPGQGTILEIYLHPGELAAPGRPIYKMADLDKMILRVFISGEQLASLEQGDSVKVLFDEKNGELGELTGTVSWISSQAEFTPKIIQTREERVNLVYAVKVKVPNNGSLKIGMPGEIQLMENNNEDNRS